MKTMNAFLMAAFLLGPHAEAGTKQKSTITLGRSEGLVAQPAKKRSLKHDVEAVAKSHEIWKKAHLNSALYACQHNSERVAMLARKVADKIEASKKDATADAKAVGKLLAEALGDKANATELPAQISNEETARLRAKLSLVESAKKRSRVLERLANQVMKFYVNDIPRSSAFAGKCQSTYAAALRKGLTASQQYHADTFALSQKLNGLSKLVETALNKRLRAELVAGR